MLRHLLVLLGGAALIAFCLYYPFLPGPYDATAVTLWVMARLFGMAGLALIPVGLVWLAYEIRMRPGTANGTAIYRGRWFAFTALALATLVASVVSLGALVDHHMFLGVAAMVLWAYLATRLFSTLRRNERRTFNVTPLYLIVWPLVAGALEFGTMAVTLDSSRARVIDAAAPLIAEIERYRERRGHYPVSLHSLWDDYRPSVVGLRRYYYEPSGDAYNLYFEHFAKALDQKEVVMYNPRDEQDFSSHNGDLLQFTDAEIALARGHVAVHDASRPHWKYFLFD